MTNQANHIALQKGWHTVRVDGLKLAYQVAGRGPICVVHPGGPGISSRYLRMPLLEEHLTMVYLDPIGAGKSDLLPGGQYSIPTYARLLHAVLDQIGQPNPVVMGHSHGGMVVLELAIQNSRRLSGVIAYDTAPVYTDELWDEAFRQMTKFAARWHHRPEAVEAARVWHAIGGGEPPIDTKFLAQVLPAYFADYRQVFSTRRPPQLDVTRDPNRINAKWRGRGRLGAIEVPTLIICGDFDFVCPPRWSKEICASIGHNAEQRGLHYSGHFGHLEQPHDFANAVLEFVRTSR